MTDSPDNDVLKASNFGVQMHKIHVHNPLNNCGNSSKELAKVKVADAGSSSSKKASTQSVVLDEWLTKNATNTGGLFKQRDTFYDHGIRRFVNSWEPVPSYYPGDEDDIVTGNRTGICRHTGCIVVPIEGTHAKSLFLRFIFDWRKLWLYLSFSDNHQDMYGLRTSLFKVIIDFFFHPTTFLVMTFVSVWNILVLFVLNYFLPTTLLSNLDLLAYTLKPVVFAIFYRNFKSMLLGSDLDRTSSATSVGKQDPQSTSTSPASSAPRPSEDDGVARKVAVPWSVAYRRVQRKLWDTFESIQLKAPTASQACERRYLDNGMSLDSTNSAFVSAYMKKDVSFYHLMGISLKFLHRHTGYNCEALNKLMNSKIYLGAQLGIVFGLFVYYFLQVYGFLLQLYIRGCVDGVDNNSGNCVYVKVSFGLTFGFTTIFLQMYVFGVTLSMAVISLLYGTSISRALAESWIDRFISLRTMQMDDTSNGSDGDEDERDVENPNRIGSSEDDKRFEQQPLLSGANKQERKASCSGATISVTCSSSSSSSSDDKSSADAPATAEISVDTIIPHISKDSFEHYLFVCEYNKRAGSMWSTSIASMFALAFYFNATSFVMLLQLYIYNKVMGSVGFTVFVALINPMWSLILLVLLPIFAVAGANANILPILESFKYAGPDDYEAIGGKEKWQEFVTAVPAAWEFFGIWITYDRISYSLYMLGTTALTAVVYVMTPES